MHARTPPLPALRAFAAWVRLGTVQAAADELGLTAGAVSHQIRALETFLDIALVERQGKKWRLTDSGRIYGYQVRQALQDIADVTERLRRRRQHQPAPQTLRVAVLPSFAQGWLLPRLADFMRWHPEVRLQLHGSMQYDDLAEGRLDCAIRFGHGQWPEVHSRLLMGDQLMLLASPQLLADERPEGLKALLQLPLLHASENWSAWLASLPEADPQLQRPSPLMAFSDSTHLLEAARLGLGVALGRRSIADSLLRRRELVAAHPQLCAHSSSYYVLRPLQAAAHPAREAFVDWLEGACARFAARQDTEEGRLAQGAL
jgi:LysR family transcriptional regulator, glycine cleavage system transcriptional activator